MIVVDKLKILLHDILQSPETVRFNGVSIRELRWVDKEGSLFTIWRKSNQFEFLKIGEEPILQEAESLLFFNFSDNHLLGDYIKVSSIEDISSQADIGQVYLVERE